MCNKSYIDVVCNNGFISLHFCSPIMTSATKIFYICSIPSFVTNYTTSGGKYICIFYFKFVYDDFDAILEFDDISHIYSCCC